MQVVVLLEEFLECRAAPSYLANFVQPSHLENEVLPKSNIARALKNGTAFSTPLVLSFATGDPRRTKIPASWGGSIALQVVELS